MKLEIETPRVFQPLLAPSRYKGAWGGRGSGKSHYFAELLTEEHLLHKGLHSVCIREVQKTLKQSAKKLIENKISKYNLTRSGFKVYNDVIKTPGDGLIIFQGMQDHTAESIKSLEGFGRAWVEEAQTLSKTSLQLLRPTIREKDSELWFSWNPRRKVDAVDMLLRGENIPSRSLVVKSNWCDNPWFPKELEQERLDDLEQRPDTYDHVWDGGYVTAQDGAYFAKNLLKAKQENRICRVPIDPLFNVHVFVDIGGTGAKADACAMWCVQFIGREIRVINYYEAQGQELSEHVGWLKRNKYDIHNTNIYLPHDGVKNDSVFRVSWLSEFKKVGYKTESLANAGVGAANQRIEGVRKIFALCSFDEKKCEAGIEALGWYHEKKDEQRGVGLGPEHDWSSHACDAFGAMALEAEKIMRKRPPPPPKPRQKQASGGWMKS